MSVKITTVAKQLPPFSRKTEDIIPFVEAWLEGQESRFKRKVIKIFEGAGVEKRYSIMEPLEIFSNSNFEERNNIYKREIKKLGREALQKALEQVNWSATDIDFLITVSCTGIMIPSVDAYLINDLKMRQDVVRLPVTEMGCVAGISGIIYANNFLKANPGKRAAVIAIEAPTATFLLNDFSMVNIVSAAIFGDGAACALMSSNDLDKGVKILADEMYHFYDATNMMGFDMTNSGLKMILDKDVPQQISKHFPFIINPFLAKYNKSIDDIDHLIFHPGGKKIIQTAENLFGSHGKNIDDTKEILKLYGNMSSATVLYVLERFMSRKIPSGDLGLMLSFGPGFSAQQLLLEF